VLFGDRKRERKREKRRTRTMPNQLQGKKIAFLTANEGVEQVELTEPWQAVRDAGAEAELLAPAGWRTPISCEPKRRRFSSCVPFLSPESRSA
jgi:hypothetical protein